jgi:hypothetical protein
MCTPANPAISPIATMADWTDSLYQYVKKRIHAVNPNRKFGGIVEAIDWPLKKAQLEAFYFIKTTADPNRGQGVGTNSWFSPLYGMRVQWAWQIIGDNIQPQAQEANRKDRYRINATMQQELLTGMFPGFCEKQNWNIQPDGSVTATSYIPTEMIWFSKPNFGDRIDRGSGILFSSAASIVTSFAPEVLA